MDNKRPALSVRITRSRILILVLAVLLVMNVISLIGLASVKKTLKADTTDYSTEIRMLSSEVERLNQANRQLSDQISELQQAPATTITSETTTPAESTLTITWQPLDVTTVVGRKDALFLSAKAESSAYKITFTWQKLNTATNAWEDLEFVAPGYNEQFGLRLYDNSANGETQLWANGLTEGAFGSYRCVVKDSDGSQLISNTAIVSVKVDA